MRNYPRALIQKVTFFDIYTSQSVPQIFMKIVSIVDQSHGSLKDVKTM